VGKLLKDPHLHFEMEHDGIVVSGETPKKMLVSLLAVMG